MRHCLSILMGLLLGVALSLPNNAYAQEKEKKAKAAAKEDRLSGTVQSISKDAKSVTVRVRGATRTIVWDANTRWTYDNKPGSVDQLKEGLRAIALGKFNDKAQLMATRIELTEEKGR